MPRVLLTALVLLLVGIAAPADPLPVEAGGQGFRPLFNGKDLAGFDTWLEKLGKNNDPDRVFRVRDGVLCISGKTWGGLITEKEYENYHLVVEFRWGEQTWPPRQDNARDSGLLLHCIGPEGAVRGLWMQAIECNLMEGRTGNFILFSGREPTRLTVPVRQHNGLWIYQPDAPARDFVVPAGADEPRLWGRIGWFGRDPHWMDTRGFRGARDLEKPLGQWNRVECLCHADTVTVLVNGQVANRGTHASPRKGRIMLQSESAEVFFRKIELKPLQP